MAAFALASALFQRERTGRGQRIDLAMLDVAMILMSSHLTGFLRNGVGRPSAPPCRIDPRSAIRDPRRDPPS
jgi:crotonobetainyl-CoA:carnitine CoA-transferase CaiB-like acyl-CoA transferase